MNSKNLLVGRLGRSFGAQGFLQAIQLFIRIAEVPLFLKYWGATGYGEWLMISSLPSTLALSDGGITKTARREMVIRAGRSDYDGVLTVFQSTLFALIVMSILIVGVITAILPFIPINEWLNIGGSNAGDMIYTLLILAVQVLVSFQCSLLFGGFASEKITATGTIYLAITQLLGFVGMAAGVIFSKEMIFAASGALIGQCIGMLIMWFVLLKYSPRFKFGFKYSSFFEIKKLATPSFANLAFPFGEAINIQGVRLLVGVTLGPTALATYSSLRTLCRAALQPVMSIARTIEPELSRAYGNLDFEKIRYFLVKGSQSAFWLSLMLCTIILFIGRPVFVGWTGGNLIFDWSVFLVLLSASLLNSLWCVALTVPCATNRHIKIAGYFIFIYGIIFLFLAFGLAKLFGLTGIAIALLLVEVLMLIVTMYVALAQAEQSFLELFNVTMTFPRFYLKYVNIFSKYKK